ncbi:hypothetical protein FHW88_000021 [Mucilaginibacter sp. SG538B]|uniref:hypothetical protein n=1 Tax=unclassified Mucilaginibacter TaxID=2617802 RepID=UPI00087181C7|nr:MULTISPECIES: hypothetical protein [unclassified Mucilaginibacter]NVM61745.1 hypothetical protein [Mucilaginibacter sp. SG538B]SCW85745.1 hypothetical protein SAMN03159284_05040 [Mucilaginibacter sp. NFR10]
MTDEFKLLIEKLIKKTSAKQAIWSKTSRDNEYKLELQKGAITVDNWDNGNGVDLVDITILNEYGDTVDRVYFDGSDEDDYTLLIELHTLAKRAFYKVEETIKGIVSELDSEKTVGKERRIDDSLDF